MPALIAWLTVFLTLTLPLFGPLALGGIFAVIVYASFGVMHRADALARALGEPFGTIILTLSIVIIEVAMVASVLLGPGDHSSIARDTAISSAMLILNVILGLAIIVGALRHGPLRVRRWALMQYLVTLAGLGSLSFIFPLLFHDDGALRGVEAAIIGVAVLGLYATFMRRQLGARSADFAEAKPAPRSHEPVGANVAWLVATLAPIVFLSHAMSPLLDAVVPSTTIAGLILAAVALLPETLTTLRAGWDGQTQRVSNLTHGALVSVFGASIPSVLVLGGLMGQTITLGGNASELGLLAATLLLQSTALACGRLTILHGAGHLLIFAAYALALVS